VSVVTCLVADQALADGLVGFAFIQPMSLFSTSTACEFTRGKGTAKGWMIFGEAATTRKWMLRFDLLEEMNEATIESRREIEKLMLLINWDTEADLT
jgi:hypothetical protein